MRINTKNGNIQILQLMQRRNWGMFSLDNGTGQRFLTKSEICVVVDNEKKATN